MTPLGRLRARQRPTRGTEPRGYFDGVIDGTAVGWCWLPDDPETKLTVEVEVDGNVVATGPADGRRESLMRAGFGDGFYAFFVKLPEELDDGGTHEVAVLAEGVRLPTPSEFMTGGRRPPRPGEEPAEGDGADATAWTTTTFTAPAGSDAPTAGEATSDGAADGATVARPPAGPATELRGYVEGISAGELFGWVVDPTQSEASLEVEAFFDGTPLGRKVADLFRLDVDRAGYGPTHGFRFELPGPASPGQHSVEVRTVPEGLTVPIESRYVVVDDRGEPIEGVTLRPAARSAARPLGPPRQALLGRDGWLFEWPGVSTFQVLCGVAEPPPQMVSAQLERVRGRDAVVRPAGAALLEAIVPAKLAVYADQLPAGLPVEAAQRPAELLAAAVREENVVDVIDLADVLRQARAHGEVFTRTGRGLTWAGAFAAYRMLAKLLAAGTHGLEPLLRDRLRLGELELVADSLAALPRVGWTGSGPFPAAPAAETEDQEGEPALEWAGLAVEYAVIDAELAELTGPDAVLLRRRADADEGQPAVAPWAIVLHDGSAARIAPFLAEHFERTLVLGPESPLDRLLAELTPAAVVEVLSEQSLLPG